MLGGGALKKILFFPILGGARSGCPPPGSAPALDYADGVNELLTAGGRALGALVSKYFNLDGMDYETYTKLFESTVNPIIDYVGI